MSTSSGATSGGASTGGGGATKFNKETVYIDKTIAETFKLQNFKNVVVRKVPLADIVLDSVELTFKEQYLGRSEMWRLKELICGSCLFLNKKIELCKGAVRLAVNEMWGQVMQL